MNKKIIGMVSVLALLVVCSVIYFGTPGKVINVSMTAVNYENLDELESKADIIISGDIEKDFSEYSPTIKYSDKGIYEDFYTLVNVNVEKVFKGSNIPKTIHVIQGAALVNSSLKKQKDLLTLEGFTPFEKDKKYVMFLVKTDIGYGLLGVNQGKFNIDGLDTEENDFSNKDTHFKILKESVLKKYK